MEEFAREERVGLRSPEERKRRRLRLLEEAIRFDELVLDAGAATQKLRRMAEIEGRSGWWEIAAYLSARAGEHYERGEQKGENSALLVSIAAYREALKERMRERAPRVVRTEIKGLVIQYTGEICEPAPLDWAAMRNNLGTALWTLGERESGTGRLEEAVAAFRAALKETSRARAPLDWATTQNNLGNALQTLVARG